MKKIIKIVSLLMFILLVLGITTSKALDVDGDTSRASIKETLDQGGTIRIHYSGMMANSYMYCREKGAFLRDSVWSTYSLESKRVYPNEAEESLGNKKYAIAYIFGCEGYSKSDRQKAYWKILGANSGYTMTKNSTILYESARAYQNFKASEVQFSIEVNDNNSSMQGNYLIYGPIIVNYSYLPGDLGSFDGTDLGTIDFGGFDFSFQGTNVNTTNVQLCKRNGSTYENIDVNNDRKIRKADYSGEELYLKIDLREVAGNSINMTIKNNSVDFTATVYQLTGTHHVTGTETVYCTDCLDKKANATENLDEAIEQGRLFKDSNGYWENKGTINENVTMDTTTQTSYNFNTVKFVDVGSSRYAGALQALNARAYGTNYWYCNGHGTSSYYGYAMAQSKLKTHMGSNHLISTMLENGMYEYKCRICNIDSLSQDDIIPHIASFHTNSIGIKTDFSVPRLKFEKWNGCQVEDVIIDREGHTKKCGTTITYETNSEVHSQNLTFVVGEGQQNNTEDTTIEIPLLTSIEVFKEWNDYNNLYGTRPNNINFNVYRSTDRVNWSQLEDTDYIVEWENQPETGDEWKAKITGLKRLDSNGNIYYFKVEEQALSYYNASYNSGSYEDGQVADAENKTITITNNLKKISLSGSVWLDGQTGIKPARTYDGIMQETETKMAGIKVVLYYKAPGSDSYSPIAETVTDANGDYKFEDREIGRYYIRFKYDGINYEDTISVEGDRDDKSKAFEYNDTRTAFNGKFHTITPGKSFKANGENGMNLSYHPYSGGKSTLSTKNSDGSVNSDFEMNANIEGALYRLDTANLNLGLVKRGMDIALSTDVCDAKVTINGQETDYTYSGERDLKLVLDEATGEYIIGNQSTLKQQEVPYTLNLYTSDYNYRIRDYVSNNRFTQDNYTEQEASEGNETGAELDVFVKYKLNLQNQSTKTVKINEVKYVFDTKYTCLGIFDNNDNNIEGVAYTINDNVITISSNTLQLGDGDTKTIYILFRVNKTGDAVTLGDFSNKAEITSYSTDEGLIDVDSQPGNFMATINDERPEVEDDSDTAGGLTIKVDDTRVRKITGKVFDNNSNTPVNGVIVQLIELKTFGNKVYEYIWQETVSGNKYGYKTPIDASGTGLDIYNFDESADGHYEFKGYIPGNYIVRFIYGDGENILDGDVNCDMKVDNQDVDLLNAFNANTQELSEQGILKADVNYDGVIDESDTAYLLASLNSRHPEQIVKYNGQDYKSVVDSNYNSEWYNSNSDSDSYTAESSVARDNEARRLETMAYSVNIDAKKGLLLKLLDNIGVENLNQTEKETLLSKYNEMYDPDKGIDDMTNADITKLLVEEVLENTWMCAETSKIKVAVDTSDITNTSTSTSVNGLTTSSYVSSISNINLGLEKRPETKIELKKYITGFKLTAANGQTLVNAVIDVNKYLDGIPADEISGEVQGIKDSVTILGTVWQYEVAPTEINTIIDGANLEFEYTLVVKNTGDNDYLSTDLANAYNNSSSWDVYKTYLDEKADGIKGYMKGGTYNDKIGEALGNRYYVGEDVETSEGKVLTQVTNIRDYVNNDLKFVTSDGNVAIDETAPRTHYILRDDYSMQQATINTILKTTQATNKMNNDGKAVLYRVTLGKNPISSTGDLEFENYIAEVMSYTNAAGRRATTSTPGNAEIIDHEHRKDSEGNELHHEIDEAETAKIQISAATGEDEQTNYIIIASVIAGITLIAAGAFAVKKYVIK